LSCFVSIWYIAFIIKKINQPRINLRGFNISGNILIGNNSINGKGKDFDHISLVNSELYLKSSDVDTVVMKGETVIKNGMPVGTVSGLSSIYHNNKLISI